MVFQGAKKQMGGGWVGRWDASERGKTQARHFSPPFAFAPLEKKSSSEIDSLQNQQGKLKYIPQKIQRTELRRPFKHGLVF